MDGHVDLLIYCKRRIPHLFLSSARRLAAMAGRFHLQLLGAFSKDSMVGLDEVALYKPGSHHEYNVCFFTPCHAHRTFSWP